MNLRLRSNAIMAVAEQLVVGITFFVLYGVLIRSVGAEQVGILSLVLVLTSVGQLANIGFGSALLRAIPMHEGRGERHLSIASIETSALCSALFYGGLLLIAYYPFQYLITIQAGPQYAPTIAAMMVPATINVFAMGLGAVSTAGLSSIMRNDLRAVANIVGGILCLAIVFLATPRYGVVAGFWALAAQSIFVLLATWLFLYRQLPGLHLIPRRLNRTVMRDLVKVGYKLQLQSLLVMALEPLSRLLIGHFGTLSQVTYFSMAARYVMQMRGIVYSASQPILSAFSYLRESDPARQQQLYATFSTVIGLAAIAMLSATAAAAPFVGELWIGKREPLFEGFAILQSLGWLAVTVILGSYFNAYSLGFLRYNLGSHVVMAVANLVLGVALGWAFGPWGVVVALTISLVLAGLIMGIGNARFQPHGSRFLSLSNMATLALGCAAVGTAVAGYHFVRGYWPMLASGLASGVIWAAVMLPAFAFHSERGLILNLLRLRIKRRG
ncbi:MAG: lipopolysaccharide biosynthesis protein [Sphingomonadales bacterium]|nr:MAG: lipopolysaccharide biosynthesis protein [Sphingomonadales bacterium]